MRQTSLLMEGWLFTGPSGKIREVDLPHTWNAIDGQDGGNDYYRGSCAYEKNFRKPIFDEQKECVYLVFHGVNASATVFLNGKQIGTHDNGYSTFRIEITELLSEENIVRVNVDNSVNDRVYPQKADFTFYGGIYREVELLVVAKDHFDLDYFGGPGIKVTPRMEKEDGVLELEAYTNLPKDGSKKATICLQITDAEGKTVATAEQEVVEGKISVVLPIEKPHRWDGVEDPYLYQAECSLKCGESITDKISTRFGFREFVMDPEKGFFLNGRSYPLHGVSRHQDFKGIGNAISHEKMENDMQLIREVGANTIRLAHYQHDQYFYDLCDQYGMVVWAEIPYISSHMVNGRENTFFQMRELITQNYNHPCIVTWGISNEITIDRKNKKDMLDNHHALQAFCKELDPTRPTTLACYAMCGPFHPVTKISDLVGWNLYLGWYVPGLFLNDLFMKFYHFVYPNRCLGYSEYGAEGMPNLHSDRCRRGDHTEEYQAKYHEYMLECFKRHPFLWATYVWNMFDFAADARDQGGEPGMNHKGLVTFDRKIKKDSFYLYKAWWSKEPFVHMSGKRFQYRTKRQNEITVYSNQTEVSLYQNGKLVETKTGEHVFRFRVELEAENEFVVQAKDLKDQGTIFLTDKLRPEYKVQKGKSQNWV